MNLGSGAQPQGHRLSGRASRPVGTLALQLLVVVATLACRLASPPPHSSESVLTAGLPGTWDSGLVHAPSIVKRGAGYLMYYDGTAGDDPYRGWSIGLATSSDGLRWEKHADNPIVTGAGGSAHDPGVLRIADDRYLMWHAGLHQDRWYIYHGQSSDGVRWTLSPEPVLGPGGSGTWDETGVAYPSVQRDGGRFHMWYQGRDWVGRWRVGHATASDAGGASWDKDPANPVLNPGPLGAWDSERVFTPAVAQQGSGWLMVYAGSPQWGLGYAYSRDGSRWTKALGSPFLLAPQGAQVLTPAMAGQRLWFALVSGGRIGIHLTEARPVWPLRGQSPIQSREAAR